MCNERNNRGGAGHARGNRRDTVSKSGDDRFRPRLPPSARQLHHQHRSPHKPHAYRTTCLVHGQRAPLNEARPRRQRGHVRPRVASREPPVGDGAVDAVRRVGQLPRVWAAHQRQSTVGTLAAAVVPVAFTARWSTARLVSMAMCQSYGASRGGGTRMSPTTPERHDARASIALATPVLCNRTHTAWVEPTKRQSCTRRASSALGRWITSHASARLSPMLQGVEQCGNGGRSVNTRVGTPNLHPLDHTLQ